MHLYFQKYVLYIAGSCIAFITPAFHTEATKHMNFSNNAYKYLDKLNHNKEYISINREQVINFFQTQGIPVFDKIADFQMEYSGLVLTIDNKPGETFTANLFSINDILTNTPIDYLIFDGNYYFYCGDHKTAQFQFVLSQDGEICIYDNTDKTINKIFSSFEKMIETYALQDLLSKNRYYEHPPFYKLTDISVFNNLTKEYISHLAANDHYNEWFSKEKTTIHKGKWYDENSFFIHIYGENKPICEMLTQVLKENKIIA